ncbi:MAG: hypothetical protein QHH07_08375 [Sedimentisphaerales bacterium]|jgi:DNA-binding response OmpR family regulator|nr:hypothetical protein [Sedimentisphaerales bacterium]
MVYTESRPGKVTVLAAGGDRGWPAMVEGLFRPAGVDLISVRHRAGFIDALRQRSVHAAIIDIDQDHVGLSMVRVIRIECPNLPCLLLSSQVDEHLLITALEMDVFSVLNKPPDIGLLCRQLDRLFLRVYQSSLFGNESVDADLR